MEYNCQWYFLVPILSRNENLNVDQDIHLIPNDSDNIIYLVNKSD